MEPVTGPGPAPRRLPPPAILLLFAVVSGLWALLGATRGVEHLTSDQHLNLVLVLKGLDPAAFPTDLVFDGPDIAGQYIPLYIGYLRRAYLLTGDLAAGYKLLVFPLNFLYLAGAYLVFRRFGGSPGLASGLALFAGLPMTIPLAGEVFGIGPVQILTARSLFTAAFPWLFLAFCRWLTAPARLVGLFLGIGLLANLHPVSGLFVAPMLILAYLLERRAGWRAWGWGLGMGLATLLGAAPILWSQLHRLAAQEAGSAQAGAELMRRLVADRMGYLLYPPYTLAALPRPAVDALTLLVALAPAVALWWGWARGSAAAWRASRLTAVAALAYLLFPEARLLLAAVAALALLPWREGESSDGRVGTAFAAATFWVSVGILVALQGLCALLDRPLLFADTIRGGRFAPFALCLLLALGIRQLDWRRLRPWVRGLVILTLLLAVGWEVRGVARTYLRTRGDAAAADLVALAHWARLHTDPRAAFLFDSPGFRVLARRSLAFATKDGTAVIYHRQDRAGVWVERQALLRAAGTDAAALRAAAARIGVPYVVVPAPPPGAGPLPSPVRYANRSYAVLATDAAPPD
jgi:hypothetical protein